MFETNLSIILRYSSIYFTERAPQCAQCRLWSPIKYWVTDVLLEEIKVALKDVKEDDILSFVESDEIIDRITIFSLLGNPVLEKNECEDYLTSVNVSKLPPGLFIARIYFKSGDAGSLLEKLQWVIEHQGEIALSSKILQKHVHNNYSWDVITCQYFEVYKEVAYN